MIEWITSLGEQARHWAYLVPVVIVVLGAITLIAGRIEQSKHYLSPADWSALYYTIGGLLFLLGVVAIGTIGTIRLIQELPLLG